MVGACILCCIKAYRDANRLDRIVVCPRNDEHITVATGIMSTNCHRNDYSTLNFEPPPAYEGPSLIKEVPPPAYGTLRF